MSFNKAGCVVAVPNDYRKNAIDCVKMAMRSPDPDSRLILRALAQSWLKLADQALTDDTAALPAVSASRH